MRKLLALFVLRLIYQQIRGRVTRSGTPTKWRGGKANSLRNFKMR